LPSFLLPSFMIKNLSPKPADPDWASRLGLGTNRGQSPSDPWPSALAELASSDKVVVATELR